MKLTVKTDLRGALRKLESAGGSARKVLRREVDVTARAFTREIATEWTPPAGPDARGTKAKKLGEAAVTRDIRRIYATAAYAFDTIKDPVQADYFWFLILAKQFGEAQSVLQAHSYNVRMRYAPLATRPDLGLHSRNRKRGRVPRSTHAQQIVTNAGALNSYIRQRRKNVGLLMAGWLSAARYFKIKLPAWVERHGGSGSTGRVTPSILPWRTQYRITNNASHGGANDLPRKSVSLAEIKMNQLRRRLPFVIKSEIKKLNRLTL